MRWLHHVHSVNLVTEIYKHHNETECSSSLVNTKTCGVTPCILQEDLARFIYGYDSSGNIPEDDNLRSSATKFLVYLSNAINASKKWCGSGHGLVQGTISECSGKNCEPQGNITIGKVGISNKGTGIWQKWHHGHVTTWYSEVGKWPSTATTN